MRSQTKNLLPYLHCIGYNMEEIYLYQILIRILYRACHPLPTSDHPYVSVLRVVVGPAPPVVLQIVSHHPGGISIDILGTPPNLSLIMFGVMQHVFELMVPKTCPKTMIVY